MFKTNLQESRKEETFNTWGFALEVHNCLSPADLDLAGVVFTNKYSRGITPCEGHSVSLRIISFPLQYFAVHFWMLSVLLRYQTLLFSPSKC